jgi:uncharacterized membrane protein affecting hemolysin expression
MNERIKELTEQAGIDEWWDSGSERREGLQEHLEKLAELIVRECGVALSPMLRDMVSRGQAFDLIKQHFGFEE